MLAGLPETAATPQAAATRQHSSSKAGASDPRPGPSSATKRMPRATVHAAVMRSMQQLHSHLLSWQVALQWLHAAAEATGCTEHYSWRHLLHAASSAAYLRHPDSARYAPGNAPENAPESPAHNAPASGTGAGLYGHVAAQQFNGTGAHALRTLCAAVGGLSDLAADALRKRLCALAEAVPGGAAIAALAGELERGPSAGTLPCLLVQVTL